MRMIDVCRLSTALLQHALYPCMPTYPCMLNVSIHGHDASVQHLPAIRTAPARFCTSLCRPCCPPLSRSSLSCTLKAVRSYTVRPPAYPIPGGGYNRSINQCYSLMSLTLVSAVSGHMHLLISHRFRSKIPDRSPALPRTGSFFSVSFSSSSSSQPPEHILQVKR